MKARSGRVWRVLFPVVIGASVAFVLAAYWRAQPLEAKAPDSGTGVVARSASVSAGEAYTIYVPSLSRWYDEEAPPFGVQFYGALDGDSGLEELTDAGANWIRLHISWGSIEPSNTTPENYNWSRLDASVIDATDRNVELILTLAGQPAWAAVYPQGPVTDTKDIEEFLGALVERYDGDGVADAPGSPRVTYFELYNEPDNGDLGHAVHGGWGCWGDFDDDVPGCGDAKDYAGLLQLLHPLVKEANPRARLVLGGLALDWFAPDGPFDPNFLDTLLAACQGHACFDVMNFHYYPPFRSRWDPYGTAIIGKANYVRERLAAAGRTDAPVMCTETTWDSAASWGSDELQSRYAIKVYVRGMAADLDVVTWYWARDREAGGGAGLLDVGLQPKDSYRAFQGMTRMLSHALYRRRLTLAETGDVRIEGYVFQTPGCRLDVVWTEDDTPYVTDDDPVLRMTVDARSLRVVDKFGNEIERRDDDDGAADGQVTIEVGGSPVYIEHNP